MHFSTVCVLKAWVGCAEQGCGTQLYSSRVYCSAVHVPCSALNSLKDHVHAHIRTWRSPGHLHWRSLQDWCMRLCWLTPSFHPPMLLTATAFACAALPTHISFYLAALILLSCVSCAGEELRRVRLPVQRPTACTFGGDGECCRPAVPCSAASCVALHLNLWGGTITEGALAPVHHNF